MHLIPVEREKIQNCGPNNLSVELYSAEEVNLLNELKHLFEAWYLEFKTAENGTGKIFEDYIEDEKRIEVYNADDMSFDGFYPGYLRQKTRILFIGREGLGISHQNYIEHLYKAFFDNKISKRSLNQSVFHRRVFYIAWSILKGEKDYPTVPYASDMLDEFRSKQISYSFMNLSKFSNERDGYQANWPLIKKSVELSTRRRNLIGEEIALLNPDIIFSMRLDDYLPLFGKISPLDPELFEGKDIKPYEIVIGNRPRLLLNTMHFSSRMVEKEVLFDRVVEILKMYRGKFGLDIY